jgi:hypothetical protein
MPRVFAPTPFRWTDGQDYPYGWFDLADDSKARAMKAAGRVTDGVFDAPDDAATPRVITQDVLPISQLAGQFASVAPTPAAMKAFGGIPIVTFNNGLSDINAGQSFIGSGGSYTPRPGQGLTAATPIGVAPGPSGAFTEITVDLSASQTSNLRQFFYENANAVIAVLLKVPANRPYTGFTLYATTQAANYSNNNWANSTVSFSGLSRPGWYMLGLTLSRYGFADTSNTVQYGMTPDTTSAANNLLDNNTTPIDRLKLRFSSSSANTVGTAEVLVDSVWLLPHSPGISMLHMDDGYISQYTEGFEYAARRGVPFTLGIVSSLLDTAGYMTTAQAMEIYAAGNDLVNHSHTHINVNAKTTNGVATSQTPTSGALTLTASPVVLDAPRCITLNCTADDTGRPLTIVGLDENGQAQTTTIYGTNASQTVTEEVWTRINSITAAATWTGAITIGTTYSYAEQFTEYNTCKAKLVSMGVTRGLDCAIYPTGASNTLTDRVMAALGITVARTLNTPAYYAYPFAPGFNPLQLPGYGGGGSTAMNQAFRYTAARYNTGNGTIGGASFTANATPQLEWSVLLTSGTTFNVVDNSTGVLIGSGTVGTPFTSYARKSPLNGANWTVTFTVTAGGTAFVAGDEFAVFVTSLATTYNKETARRMACGCCYFHKIARNGAQDSLTTMVPDFRATVDEMAKDRAAGRVKTPTMSQFSAMLKNAS